MHKNSSAKVESNGSFAYGLEELLHLLNHLLSKKRMGYRVGTHLVNR
jgi:hypothetical protein